MSIFLSVVGMIELFPETLDELNVPEGVDRTRAWAAIARKTGQLGLLYTEPETFRSMVYDWSLEHKNNWERMLSAMQEEYNPTHNYDRYETSDDRNTDSREETNKGKYSENNSANSSHTVAGFNEQNTLVPDYSDSGRGEREGDSEQTREQSGQGTNHHEAHLYGNIGVTSTMELIEAEINLRAKYNIYDIIANDFKREFCIMVY